MKKSKLFIVTLILFAMVTILIARDWRIGQIPNGEKFSCGNCHIDIQGGGPRNDFGKLVETKVTPAGHEEFWNSTLAFQDSDGDGFTNGQELGDPNGTWRPGQPNPGSSSAVSNPGDPNSVPIPADVEEKQIPTAYRLLNNYPNPFNPSTVITFEIPQSEYVTLKVFNINGQLIRTLTNENLSAGKYEKNWDGKNEIGHEVSSGIYIYRLTAGRFDHSVRMMLMK